LIASGSVDGVSTGAACAAGVIAASSRTSDSSSLSDFANSFEEVAISTLLRPAVASTDEEAGGVAALIAIEAIEVTRQKTAIHIVLVIGSQGSRIAKQMGAELQDQIQAARWLPNGHLERAERPNSIGRSAVQIC